MDWRSEHWGGSRAVTLSGDGYKLSPPARIPGGCRFYRITPDANRYVVLPRGDLVPNGESITIYNPHASFAVTVKDLAGNTIAVALAESVVEVFQTASSTNGLWTAIRTLGAEEGSAITNGRVPLDVYFGADATTFDLRRHHDVFSAYDGVTPAALRVFVGSASRHYIIGATGPTDETAFDTGEWPAGSSLLLFNWGTIIGKGGDGGRGGDVPPGLLAQPGGIGTTGMRCRIDTRIVNYGTIAGGGGGGGGSAWNGSTSAGSGGGGGQGHSGGRGGDPGDGAGGVRGVDGWAFGAGGGGVLVSTAGNGGGAGSAGYVGQGGAQGGAGGSAILRLSGVTVTKLVTGTILGAEGTF